MMKCRKETLERVIREGWCDAGRYRYHMIDGVIERRLISELNRLPRYGNGWERVAKWNYEKGEWELEK